MPKAMGAPAKRPLVLIVDDDVTSARALARLLASDGFDAEIATDGAAALSRLTRAPIPAAMVTDFHLPHADGLAISRYARSRSPLMPVFVVTGYPYAFGNETDPLPPPAAEVFVKPLDYGSLVLRLSAALGMPWL
jgi:DNA-binding response OmpR family regulator